MNSLRAATFVIFTSHLCCTYAAVWQTTDPIYFDPQDIYIGIDPSAHQFYDCRNSYPLIPGCGFLLSSSDEYTISRDTVLQWIEIGFEYSGKLTQSGFDVVSQGTLMVGVDNIGEYDQISGTTWANAFVLGQYGSGTYVLTDGTLNVTGQYIATIGSFATGVFSQNGGNVNISNALTLGGGSGGNGVYNLSDGNLKVIGSETIGSKGAGSFKQSGGSHTANNLSLGFNSQGSGTYELSDGVLTVNNNEVIGSSSVFTQSGGSHNVNNLVVGSIKIGTYHQTGGTVSVLNLVLGVEAPDTGYFNQDAGTIHSYTSEIIGNNGTGEFNQSGGTHAANNLVLGLNSGSKGTYNLNSGDLTVDNTEVIGNSGTGAFNQQGGTHTTYSLALGSSNNADGSYNLSRGSLQADTESIGLLGNGTFNQVDSGDSNQNNAVNLIIGVNGDGNGTYNLGGGTSHLIVTGVETIGYQGTGTFNQTGGTHSVKNLIFGSGALGDGTYNLISNNASVSAVKLTVTGIEQIGLNGIGTFNQTGGTHTVNELSLGTNTSGYGEYYLNDGVLNATFVRVGESGSGVFTQIGGTHTITGNGDPEAGALSLGDNGSASDGEYHLSGGILKAWQELIGADGHGLFEQSAGANQVDTNLIVGGGGYGEYKLSNTGNLVVSGDEFIGSANNQENQFTQSDSGTTHTIKGSLYVGGANISGQSAGTGKGAYIMNDGNLTVSGSVFIGSNGGDGIFTQSGGAANTTGQTVNSGSVSISGKNTVFTTKGFSNSGSVTISDRAILYTGSYSQDRGSTLLINGYIDPPSTIQISGGKFGGTGTIDGSVSVASGNVQVGSVGSFGSLHILGNYAQTAGTIEFFVGGDGSGNLLTSSLLFDPGANLNIQNANIVFDLGVGTDEKQFLQSSLTMDSFFQDSSGAKFSSVLLASIFQNDTLVIDLPDGSILGLQYDPTTGAIAAVPIPGVSWLLGTTMAVGFIRRKKMV